MNTVEYIVENPGIFFVILGFCILVVTTLVLSLTIDAGAAIVLNVATFTSSNFWLWFASLLFVFIIGLVAALSNTVQNKYVFLMCLTLITFIMTHISVYKSLNQIQVS